ncbi:hypothetical protein ACQKCU_24920 [Heyndrickxia sporothermodurans]
MEEGSSIKHENKTICIDDFSGLVHRFTENSSLLYGLNEDEWRKHDGKQNFRNEKHFTRT